MIKQAISSGLIFSLWLTTLTSAAAETSARAASIHREQRTAAPSSRPSPRRPALDPQARSPVAFLRSARGRFRRFFRRIFRNIAALGSRQLHHAIARVQIRMMRRQNPDHLGASFRRREHQCRLSVHRLRALRIRAMLKSCIRTRRTRR
jgi:hypothetical protein